MVRRKEWLQRRWVPQKTAVNSKLIHDLVEVGVPVGSANAGMLANYFHFYIQENAKTPDAMVREKITEAFGWQAVENGDCFLWGKETISSSNEAVKFIGADDGDKEIAASMYRKGIFRKVAENHQAI